MANPAIRMDRKAARKRGGGAVILIIVFILLLLIGGFAAAIAMNLFGIRENHIMPSLRQMPIVSNLLPEQEMPGWMEEELAVDYAALAAELQATITRLQSQLDVLQDNFNRTDAMNRDNIAELHRLREIEAQQLQFNENAREHERMLAEGDPRAFAAFFETINPDHAETLYERILGTNIRDDRWAAYVALWGALRPSNVAEMIEDMHGAHMELIISVLRELDLSTQRRIIDALEIETRGLIMRQLYPS